MHRSQRHEGYHQEYQYECKGSQKKRKSSRKVFEKNQWPKLSKSDFKKLIFTSNKLEVSLTNSKED